MTAADSRSDNIRDQAHELDNDDDETTEFVKVPLARYGTWPGPDNNPRSKSVSDGRVYHFSQGTDHCHTDPTEDVGDAHARKTIIMASILCLAFMITELIGGGLAGSLAIMTDAAHLLTDFAGFMISLFALYVASRPATRKMSFGWHRAEVLGATLSVLLIWVITGILVYTAIERIINKDYDIDASIMLITAAVGVAVNILMGIMLHVRGHGHSHGIGGAGHGHSHGTAGSGHGHAHDSVESGNNGKRKVNINVRAAFIHVIGDFFQSVGVLVAAFVIYYHPHLAIIDPICTFIFSALVLFTTIAIMRDALNVLMEAAPRGIDMDDVISRLKAVSGVEKVHNIRMWSLTMDKVAFSAHLAISDDAIPKQVLKEASQLLKNQYKVYECTIQLERFTADMNDCHRCEIPTE